MDEVARIYSAENCAAALEYILSGEPLNYYFHHFGARLAKNSVLPAAVLAEYLVRDTALGAHETPATTCVDCGMTFAEWVRSNDGRCKWVGDCEKCGLPCALHAQIWLRRTMDVIEGRMKERGQFAT